MKLPIKITKGGYAILPGYSVIKSIGKVTRYNAPKPVYAADGQRSHYITYSYDKVKAEIWVADYVRHFLRAPERIWRRVLCWLWLGRLTFQYERGYAAGLREGIENYTAYQNLTPEELEGVLAEPPHQEY